MGRAKQSEPYVLGSVPVVCQYAPATWLRTQPTMPFRLASFNLQAASFSAPRGAERRARRSAPRVPAPVVGMNPATPAGQLAAPVVVGEPGFCLRSRAAVLNPGHEMSLEIAD